jgi:hypothetical protein
MVKSSKSRETKRLAKTEEYKSAESFMAALEIEKFTGRSDSYEIPWIFRGQRSADWPLIPSAWRDGGPLNIALLQDR